MGALPPRTGAGFGQGVNSQEVRMATIHLAVVSEGAAKDWRVLSPEHLAVFSTAWRMMRVSRSGGQAGDTSSGGPGRHSTART